MGGVISLSWNLVPGANYRIERSTAGGPFSVIAYPSLGQASFSDTQLANSTPQTNYGYRISSLVDGVWSAIGPAITAVVSKATQEVAAVFSAPAPTAPTYGVATIYQWNWSNQNQNGGYFGSEALSDDDLKNTINWDKKTIILTHGWDDQFLSSDTSNFINTFASNLAKADNAANIYNVLAIDWYDNADPAGSNPNGDPLWMDIAGGAITGAIGGLSKVGGATVGAVGGAIGYTLKDAQTSANNGIAAGIAVAERLHESGAVPNNLDLIGHSNGAGLMASVAIKLKELYGGARQYNINQLVALDAPWLTNCYNRVVAAATAAIGVDNYYEPVIQSMPSKLWGCTPDFSIGAGAPMDPLDSIGNITNFELNYHFNAEWNGHSSVPERYDETSAPNSLWGFSTSPFAVPSMSRHQLGGIFVEDARGHFNPMIPNPVGSILNQVNCLKGTAAQALTDLGRLAYDKIINPVTQTVVEVGTAVGESVQPVWTYGVGAEIEITDAVVNTAMAIRDTLVISSNGLWDSAVTAGNSALNGVQSAISTSIDYATDGLRWFEGKSAGVFSLAAPGVTSPASSTDGSVLASISLHVPEDAGLMHFDLTVANPGNDDMLQVILGGAVVGQIDLASQFESGSAVDLWVGDHAGENTTLSFYMPSAVASSADFTIGNVKFASVLTDTVPTNIQALATNGTRVHLSWSLPVASVDGFIIDRSEDGGSFMQIASVSGDIGSLDDSTVSPGRSYSYRIHAFAATVNYDYAMGTVSIASAPKFGSVLVSDGTAQRSVFNSFTLNFDQVVNLASGAVTMNRVTTNSAGAVLTSTAVDASAFTILNPSGDGKTWVVTVAAGGSLDDGRGDFLDGVYQFTIHAAMVTNAYGTALAGGDQTKSFRKLFGDVNGDGRVNGADYFQFSSAFGSKSGDGRFRSFFDYNHDGRINSFDYLMFSNNFGKGLFLPL